MNLLNIGPMELVLVFVVALVVFGPSRLPSIARDLGRAVREFQTASRGIATRAVSEIESASDRSTPDEVPPDVASAGNKV